VISATRSLGVQQVGEKKMENCWGENGFGPQDENLLGSLLGRKRMHNKKKKGSKKSTGSLQKGQKSTPPGENERGK